MPIGFQHIIKFHENSAGASVLDSFVRREFNHDSSFTDPAQQVFKEDFTGSPNDAFVAQFSYPSGQEPATTTTVAQLLTRARDAVNAVYSGEAGAAA